MDNAGNFVEGSVNQPIRYYPPSFLSPIDLGATILADSQNILYTAGGMMD